MAAETVERKGRKMPQAVFLGFELVFKMRFQRKLLAMSEDYLFVAFYTHHSTAASRIY